MPGEKVLRECLGAFELRRGSRWAEARQAKFGKTVNDAFNQRRFRADDRQRNLFVPCELRQRLYVIGGNSHIAHTGLTRCPGVARGHEHLIDIG